MLDGVIGFSHPGGTCQGATGMPGTTRGRGAWSWPCASSCPLRGAVFHMTELSRSFSIEMSWPLAWVGLGRVGLAGSIQASFLWILMNNST